MKKEEKNAQIPCYKEYNERAEAACGFGCVSISLKKGPRPEFPTFEQE